MVRTSESAITWRRKILRVIDLALKKPLYSAASKQAHPPIIPAPQGTSSPGAPESLIYPLHDRFNSREVTELAKESVIKQLELVQDHTAKIGGSEAFANYPTIDHYVRFANEYTKNLYGIVVEGQEFVTRQVEEGNRRFAQVVDITGRTAQTTNESMKSAGEEVLERGRPGKPRAS